MKEADLMTSQVAIIGGGVVGAATAYYLSHLSGASHLNVTLFDSGYGQATKAAAGIIAPWLSKRRNQQWYHLARSGAALLARLSRQAKLPREVYDQSGAIMTRDTQQRVQDLYDLAIQRRRAAPTIGNVIKLNADEVKQRIPLLSRSLPGIYISGGARVNGRKLTRFLVNSARRRNLKVINRKVALVSDHRIKVDHRSLTFDWIAVATGAWMRRTLLPLNIITDIRPQKGQLIVIQTHKAFPHRRLPVLTPEGEYDFLPFGNGRLVVGATHDDRQRFNLSPSRQASLKLFQTAQHFVNGLQVSDIQQVRTGTRGYTSDYGPFFGRVPGHHHLLVGGGLGSSGLTTGPIIGKFLARLILSKPALDFDYYEKSIRKYFKVRS